ncbi:MAG: LysR family transcriptional regulator [Planctomycetota bacterium]
MNWLNYHHLLYFWMTAKEGSVSRAAEKLHLSQPTVSGQLRQLERAAGGKLYARKGQGLVLTDRGKMVYEYAEQIFTTGNELMRRLRGDDASGAIPLTVGIPDYLPKLMTAELLGVVFELDPPIHLTCREGPLQSLLSDLAMQRLDVVLSDSPVGAEVDTNVYNHFLGESEIAWVGSGAMLHLADGFPDSLSDQPLLMPTENTVLRRGIEQWLEKQSFHPRCIAEIEDGALLKTFAMQSRGLVPIPLAVLKEAKQQYGLELIGVIDDFRLQFHAICRERRVEHPGIVAITESASKRLPSGQASSD